MATLDMPANKTDTKCEKNKDKKPDIYNVGCSTTDFLEDKHIFFCNRIVDRRNVFNQSASSLSQFKSEGYMHQATIFFVDMLKQLEGALRPENIIKLTRQWKKQPNI